MVKRKKREGEGKKKKYTESNGTMNRVVYWTALLVALIGNLIISAALIPFLIVLKSFQLYIIIAILALSFGMLFNLLLKDIENVDKKHHIIAGIFIPGLAILNIFIITSLANHLIEVFKIANNPQNPYYISLVYIIAFLIPFVLNRRKKTL